LFVEDRAEEAAAEALHLGHIGRVDAPNVAPDLGQRHAHSKEEVLQFEGGEGRLKHGRGLSAGRLDNAGAVALVFLLDQEVQV
jgi:hypothetical protein